MTLRYQCDKCGACCQGHLIVEAQLLDVIREPRLIQSDSHYAGLPIDEAMTLLENPHRCLIIACGTPRPCAFLGADKCCTIYPTRPNVCVALEAGDEQCQYARGAAGLPPLQPIELPAVVPDLTPPGSS
ncbi:MAG: YkgJ family cysteine cluster protein [Planctomycetia bacterium]|nr:YkgJ family cysteine cluster protein [Planctomycetia bacterium]